MTMTRSRHCRRTGHGIFSLAGDRHRAAVAGPARAESGGTSFDEANRAFSEGHYAEAAADFESARAIARMVGATALRSRQRLCPAGQCRALGLELRARARARAARPRHRGQPGLCSGEGGSAGSVQALVRDVARSLTPTTWTGLAVVGFWLAGAGFLAARRWRRRRLGLRCGLRRAAWRDRRAPQSWFWIETLNHAVVVETKSAPVRVSPFDTAASEVALSEGEEVSVIGRHGDFVRVRDGQGRTGWVQSAAVQPIVPRRS